MFCIVEIARYKTVTVPQLIAITTAPAATMAIHSLMGTASLPSKLTPIAKKFNQEIALFAIQVTT